MRALIVLIDGVDEAAGLRDEIEHFIHQELVPSGNRLLVTSRPEGVNTAKYKGRFVIMNLNALSNEQQRAAVSVQMHGSEFFEHLLSLGEVRKKLDEVYDKMRDSVQHDLEELYAPCRFLLPGRLREQERPYDPEQRQHILVEEVTTSDEDKELAAAMAAFQTSASASATAGEEGARAEGAPTGAAPAEEAATAPAAETTGAGADNAAKSGSDATALAPAPSSTAGEAATAATTSAPTAATAPTAAPPPPSMDEVVETVVTYTHRLVQERPLPPKSLTLYALNRNLRTSRAGPLHSIVTATAAAGGAAAAAGGGSSGGSGVGGGGTSPVGRGAARGGGLGRIAEEPSASGAGGAGVQGTTLDLIDQVVSAVPLQAHRSTYESARRTALSELAHLTPASRKVAMELGLMLR